MKRKDHNLTQDSGLEEEEQGVAPEFNISHYAWKEKAVEENHSFFPPQQKDRKGYFRRIHTPEDEERLLNEIIKRKENQLSPN